MKTLTRQQIFDKVCKHLKAQGVPAIEPEWLGICSYKTKTGLKCAVGCLIPARMYRVGMEGADVREMLENFPQLASRFSGDDVELIFRLQIIHDRAGAPCYHGSSDIWDTVWEPKLRDLAKEFGLEFNAE